MRIVTPERTPPDRLVEVTFSTDDAVAPREPEAGKAKVFFRSNQPVLVGNLEGFLALGLLPSMRIAGGRATGRLVGKGEVSRTFLAGLSTIQYIYTLWDASLGRVEIDSVQPVSRPSSTGRRVGLFFSGGVDSFYSLLTHQTEVTDLIFVHGFDIPLGNVALREKVSERIRRVAAEFGKGLVEIETNVRAFLDPYVGWGLLGHGAAMAAVGHLLSPVFGRIFVGSSHTYPNLDIWGSHPILDPLWSSEPLEFIHDGYRTKRVDKVALLSGCEIALRTLRVCWENPNNDYNCGRCEKCLRTMINLQVNRALERCTTFERALDLKAVMRMKVDREGLRILTQDNLDALRKTGADDELAKVLGKILETYDARSQARGRVQRAGKGIAALVMRVGAALWRSLVQPRARSAGK